MSKNKHVHTILGLAGVANDEPERARRIGKKFELPMLLIALWILVQWYAEQQGIYPATLSALSNWVIWLFFIIETTTLTVLVNNKRRYLQGNWVNVFIIIMGVPILWGVTSHIGLLRALRLVLLGAILLNISDTTRQILAKNHLGITLLVAFFIILMSGIFIAGIDPDINTIGEGLWWAWVTVTTVGYGDIVPGSQLGKVFGAILILMGIGIFSLLTASFSAFFVARDEENDPEEKLILKKLDAIDEKLSLLEQRLEKTEDR